MNSLNTHKYHYFYKITNNINGHFYFGVHSTDNLNDSYMGSGTRLKNAYIKYGIENFTREILKFFDTEEEAFEYESSVVTESLVKDKRCYNLKVGGVGGWGRLRDIHDIPVKDKKGNIFRVSHDDPRYLSGELRHITYKTVSVKDSNGKKFRVSIDDPRYLSGELVGINKGRKTVRDNNGNTIKVDVSDKRYSGVTKGLVNVRINDKVVKISVNDPRYLSGELQHISKHHVSVRDKEGNTFSVMDDDPRYLSGELVGVTKGMFSVTDDNGKKYQITRDDPRYLSGELKFFNQNTVWINKDGKSKHVKKDFLEKFINDGWKQGRGKLVYKHKKKEV